MRTMVRLARRGIRASIWRLILTMMAIVAGVGFVSGAFILADSLTDTFTSLFENAAATVDARVTVAEPEFGRDLRTLPDTLTQELADLPEVGTATPVVQIDAETSATPFSVIGDDGEPIQPVGPPIITFSWDGTEDENLIVLADGTPPGGPGEVVIDTTYATRADVEVGQAITLATPEGEQPFTLVGLVDLPITGGAYFVLFDFDTAQVLYDKVGQVDSVDLTRAPGVSTESMIEAVAQVVPDQAVVQSQAEITDEQVAGFEQIINVLRNALLGFAAIALFVSLFIIYNTFAILVSQRLQQIGMLRALGATRGQIRFGILIEAMVVGLIGSAIGLGFGFAVANGIKGVMQATGGFPETGTVLEVRTVAVALGVGVVATIISALLPAFLAGRVSPVAAMRGEAPSRSSLRRRTVLGLVILMAGLGLLALGLFGSDQTVSAVVTELGVGAVLTFIGVALLSALFAGPVVSLIGRAPVLGFVLAGMGLALPALIFTVGDGVPDGPLGWIGFVPKMVVSVVSVVTGLSILVGLIRGRPFGLGQAATGVEGGLARQNAARAPQRTAATATALTIGIALVATVSVVGESLKSSLGAVLEQSVRADVFIYDPQTGSAFSGELADAVEEVDGVAALSRFRANQMRLGTDEGDDVVDVMAYDSATGETLVAFDVTEGDLDLGPSGGEDAASGLLVHRDQAEERGLGAGDRLSVQFPDGEVEELTVAGVFEDNSVLGTSWVIDLALYERHIVIDEDVFVAASLEPGVDPEAVTAEINTVTDEFGSVVAQDTQEFQAAQEDQVDGIISLINWLLGFALFVAFLGVINTIVLSVIERTREIGLLRAVGMTRSQIRSTIRWESVIVCLFGALLGIALGVLFAWAGVSAIPENIIDRVAFPFESILFAVLAAALAGVVAAAWPARRAARLDILQAIASTE